MEKSQAVIWEFFQTPLGKWLARSKGSAFIQTTRMQDDQSDSDLLVANLDIGEFADAFRLGANEWPLV